ncbi:DUF4123 domain-containing protein [Halomonas sp. V046]|uniref:DUF4123 domain-containing protein n=1 Tax=Halomonas sp. V046 TaxID=3459611 RepID=UPI0040448400
MHESQHENLHKSQHESLKNHLHRDTGPHHESPDRLDTSIRRMIEAIQTLDAEDGGRLYRLVDPADSTDWGLPEAARKHCGLIKHPFLAHGPERRLYLQPLSLAKEALYEGLASEIKREVERTPVSRRDAVPFCGWVYSRAPLEHITAHLYQQRVIRTARRKPALLRYQDPRVFERLTEILLPGQLNQLLGPLEGWWYIDHRRHITGCVMPPPTHLLPYTLLSSSQRQAVMRIGRGNACMDHWRHLQRDDLWEVSPTQIDERLMEAERYGLVDETDQIVFVVQSLLIPGFDRHPTIQRLLPSGGEPEPFSQAIKRLNARDWHMIQHDLEHR